MSASPDTLTPALVVLAAGMGSRYGGLKQIDPVGASGETVLDYSVYDALRAGFGKLVFVIRADFEQTFRQNVGRRFESRAEVRYVFQELDKLPGGHKPPAGREKPWGTGHAIWCARDALREPFAVINADDFYGADSFRQIAVFFAQTGKNAPAPGAIAPAPCCMVGFRLDATLSGHGTVSRGICTSDTNDFLQSVVECTAIERLPRGGARQKTPDGADRLFTGAETVSMNCWGFTPAVLPALERELAAFLDRSGASLKSEFYLPEAVASMIARRDATVKVLPTTSPWFGITYREDRQRVVDALASLVKTGAYPKNLQA